MIKKFHWKSIGSELFLFACVLAIVMTFRTTAYGMYYIPSESMLPTLTVGDRIAVNKFAYGYSRHSVPFSIGPDLDTPSGRAFYNAPKRGEIVVFKHPRDGKTLIKRVVGLPGDKVAIDKGRLYLNGVLVSRQLEDAYAYREHAGGVMRVGQFVETLQDGDTHQILERNDQYPGDFFGPLVIPENHIFVMGDNRDNSLDSRFPIKGVGLLPIENLVGRAEAVLFSTNIGRTKPGLKHHSADWFSPL
ncbi:MAG: signal peptidase I [Pseudomonadota bacterium]